MAPALNCFHSLLSELTTSTTMQALLSGVVMVKGLQQSNTSAAPAGTTWDAVLTTAASQVLGRLLHGSADRCMCPEYFPLII